jgi:tRNA(fMet)-specific endonuclease VapC
MMGYLLDTCVVSDFVKGENNTLKRLKSSSPHEILISSITVMEVKYGLYHVRLKTYHICEGR